VLDFASQRWLLSHGDALCLDDTAYLQFRQLVRSAAWQSEFLGKPLAERKELARQLRLKSESLKQGNVPYADVDTAAAGAWLESGQASTMIHGHTHRPGRHALAQGYERIVLSDWDLSAHPPRADVLRIRMDASSPNSAAVVARISPLQACATGAKPAD
jgi:UDP-2,3-diacylglucosamine hydrolase